MALDFGTSYRFKSSKMAHIQDLDIDQLLGGTDESNALNDAYNTRELINAWRNEAAAPDILPFRNDLVQWAQTRIRDQEVSILTRLKHFL